MSEVTVIETTSTGIKSTTTQSSGKTWAHRHLIPPSV
jgi:hypothetical protein